MLLRILGNRLEIKPPAQTDTHRHADPSDSLPSLGQTPPAVRRTRPHLSEEVLSGHGQRLEAADGPPQLPAGKAQLPGLPLASVLQPLDQLPLGLAGLRVGLGGEAVARNPASLLGVTYKKQKVA